MRPCCDGDSPTLSRVYTEQFNSENFSNYCRPAESRCTNADSIIMWAYFFVQKHVGQMKYTQLSRSTGPTSIAVYAYSPLERQMKSITFEPNSSHSRSSSFAWNLSVGVRSSSLCCCNTSRRRLQWFACMHGSVNWETGCSEFRVGVVSIRPHTSIRISLVSSDPNRWALRSARSSHYCWNCHFICWVKLHQVKEKVA